MKQQHQTGWWRVWPVLWSFSQNYKQKRHQLVLQSSGSMMIPVGVPQTPARQPDNPPCRWIVMLQTVVVVVANKIKLNGRNNCGSTTKVTENQLTAIIEHSSSTNHQLSVTSDTIFNTQFYLDYLMYVLFLIIYFEACIYRSINRFLKLHGISGALVGLLDLIIFDILISIFHYMKYTFMALMSIKCLKNTPCIKFPTFWLGSHQIRLNQ